MDNAKLPAYPTTVAEYDKLGRHLGDRAEHGLTKLEAFTMAAMQGLMAHENSSHSIEWIAEEAVRQACATLSELQKQQP